MSLLQSRPGLVGDLRKDANCAVLYAAEMARKWIEGQIDDALLAMAIGAGFLYLRRRVRRLVRGVAVGGAVAAGLGTLGISAAAAAWFRSRAMRSAPLAPPPASPDWQAPAAGTPEAGVATNSGGAPWEAGSPT
jgi:hypothetical protein